MKKRTTLPFAQSDHTVGRDLAMQSKQESKSIAMIVYSAGYTGLSHVIDLTCAWTNAPCVCTLSQFAVEPMRRKDFIPLVIARNCPDSFDNCAVRAFNGTHWSMGVLCNEQKYTLISGGARKPIFDLFATRTTAMIFLCCIQRFLVMSYPRNVQTASDDRSTICMRQSRKVTHS